MNKVDMLTKILKTPLLIFTLLLICFHCDGLQEDLGLRKNVHDNKTKKKPKKNPLKRYFLPQNHPLLPHLGQLFTDPQMFQSLSHFQNEGFKVKKGHRQLMVGMHPSFQPYLFKKFMNIRTNKMQLENYTRRINNANKIRQYIEEHQFHHLVVPQKWLYELPPAFADKKRKGYILIVENMDIYDDWDDPQGQARKLYYNMDKEMLTQLCTVLHDLGGCDAFPRNQPFTRSGKIAFIDTEHLGEKKLHFIKHIIPALNEEMQAYALALWNQLESENK